MSSRGAGSVVLWVKGKGYWPAHCNEIFPTRKSSRIQERPVAGGPHRVLLTMMYMKLR